MILNLYALLKGRVQNGGGFYKISRNMRFVWMSHICTNSFSIGIIKAIFLDAYQMKRKRNEESFKTANLWKEKCDLCVFEACYALE